MISARSPIALGAALLLTLSACTGTHDRRPRESSAGAADVGDRYTPGDGNGGYDVQHYGLDLRIVPGGRPELAGTATITAVTREPLGRFDLDLTGLSVSKVTVDGAQASYARRGEELAITPTAPLPGHRTFTVAVTYSGTPQEVNDPVLGRYGWVHTHDGIFVGAQPSGAHTWFPSNDHPSDKAAFDYKINVPTGLTAIANGKLTRTVKTGNTTTYTWHEPDPMATYLATADVGVFRVRTGRTPDGVPIYAAIDPTIKTITLKNLYDTTAAVTDLWTKMFGPYPFGSTGGIVDDAQVQFALETQTKPEYSAQIASEPTVIAHELSHQWFGDSVSLTRWSDIWLNEGFATWAEWTWGERIGEQSVQQQFDLRYAQPDAPDLWDVPPAAPGRTQLFGRSVYDRGAMTLQALRKKIGDARFFTILRTWAAQHRHGNASTAQFIALAEQVSGMKLDRFFRVWLYEKGRPTSW